MNPTDQPSPDFSIKINKFFGLKFPCWTNLLIWTGSIALLTFLSIRNFLPLLDDYMVHNKATQISIIKDQTSRPPNVSLCIPYYSTALGNIALSIYDSQKLSIDPNGSIPTEKCDECLALKKRGWDVWRNMSFEKCKEDCIKNRIASALLKKVFRDNDTDVLNLNESNYNWNQPIIDSLWIFFWCITFQDISVTTNVTHSNCDDFDFVVNNNSIVDELFEYLMNGIELYFVNINDYISDDGFTKNSTMMSIRDRSALTVKGSHFCFPLLSDTYNEYFSYVPFSGPDRPPWMRSGSDFPYVVYPNIEVLYSMVNKFDALVISDDKTEKIGTYETADLAYSLESKIFEGRPGKVCSHEPVPTVCVIRRQIHDILKNCGCIPFIYRKFLQDEKFPEHFQSLSYCTKEIYSKCREKARKNLKIYQDECNNKCEYVYYKWKHFLIKTKNDKSTRMSFAVALKDASIPFAEFTVTLKNTHEQFISQIGGVVNLYLGFSGLSVTAFAIFCLELFKKWKRSKNLDTVGAGDQIGTEMHGFGSNRDIIGEMKMVIQDELKIFEKRIEDRLKNMSDRLMVLEYRKDSSFDSNNF